MKKIIILLVFSLITLSFFGCTKPPQTEVEKPRVIVTCDPELDDHNSLIRYLLFSTDFDTEGIIYASSQFHWKGDGKGTTQYMPGREYSKVDRDLGPQTHWRWAEGERFIDTDIEAYESVYENLKVHNPNYPTPEQLKSKIYWGNVEFEGDISKDTPGSDLIKKVLLDDDPRPVFIQVWGGPSTASRALKSIEEQYRSTPQWATIQSKVSSKAKFCLSGQQDTTYSGYVRVHWPDVESIILNAGVISLGYGAKRGVADPADTVYFSADWTQKNIRSKGVFGELYRVWGDGKQMVPGDFADYFGFSEYTTAQLQEMGYWVWSPVQPAGSFISEGDTPMFLNLIGNGLRAHQSQEYGGWAGRKKEMTAEETAAGATAPYAMRTVKDLILPNFLPAIQNNFAARLAWSVTPDYANANHAPILEGPLSIETVAGRTVKIKVAASDPDQDGLTFSWAQYKVGSYKADVTIATPQAASTAVAIPADAKKGDTIHLVLTATDNGTPAMTHYLRTIITLK